MRSEALERLVAARIDGQDLSLRSVLSATQRAGQLALLEQALRQHLIERAIRRRGLEASPAEVARARALLMRDHGLADPPALERWLAERSLSSAALDEDLARIICFGKLKDQVASAGVEPHFAQHHARYESVLLSRLRAASMAEAQRLRLALDRGADFAALAQSASSDEKTAPHGGFLGRLRRAQLSPEVARLVFGGERGPLGPIDTPRGAEIYLVERRFPARLDAAVRAEIHQELFLAWLDGERRAARVELPLLEVLS